MLSGPLRTYLLHWLAWCRLLGAVGAETVRSVVLPGDPRQARERWLAALGRDWDRYLRSPAFLELMTLNQRLMATSMRLPAPPSRE